jgi:hypothetical protein
MKILESKSVYYDDVNLIAQPTEIKNRHIPEEKHRIFVSPMSSIVGDTFVELALKAGYSVVMHRFHKDPMEQLHLYVKLIRKGVDTKNLWASIGYEGDYSELLKRLKNAGCNNILMDIANGYMLDAIDKSIEYINAHKIENYMLGNIHSGDIVSDYTEILDRTDVKKLYLRCGISSGTACSTSSVTGYNRGQITELAEIYERLAWCSPEAQERMIIVADGGIKDSGCAMKAFGVGADCVMLGGYWRYCQEAETNLIGEHHFYGGASKRQLIKSGKGHKHSEGKDLEIDTSKLKPFSEVEHQLWGGIRSGVAYSGVKTLSSFIGSGVFELKVR